MSNETVEIVAQCLDGVPGAVTRLVQKFRGKVFGLCLKMLRQREDAEDATQETFIRVFNNLHRWDANRSFEPWLYTIAGNRCRTKLQKRNKSKEFQLPEVEVEVTSSTDRELEEEISLAIGNLKGNYKQAFRLFHVSHFSYDEIADELMVPVGTVKTWVHRARKQIVSQLRERDQIGDEFHEV